MTPLLRSLLRAPRAMRAALLLAVLVLGASLHGLHHLQDPACADGIDHGHACAVCAGLHASTLVAPTVTAPAPQPRAWTQPAAPVAVTPAARALRAATPRAPPAS